MTNLLALLAHEAPATALGVEIGAHVLPVPQVTPIYVDRVRTYVGDACKIDVQADGGALPFPDGSIDYVCSSHVLEHLPNPIAGLLEWHRVLRPGGLLYLVVPDRRHTFDISRDTTSAAHLKADFLAGTSAASEDDIHEFITRVDWARLFPNSKPENFAHERQVHLEHLRDKLAARIPIDIHYHTFTPESLRRALRETGITGAPGPHFNSWPTRNATRRNGVTELACCCGSGNRGRAAGASRRRRIGMRFVAAACPWSARLRSSH